MKYMIDIDKELEEFEDDHNDSKKKLKLITKLEIQSDLNYKSSNFLLSEPKKRFKAKVKKFIKNKDKGIF